MKIGIDISQIVYQGSGIATYTTRLVEGLLKSDKDDHFVFFGSSLRQRYLLEDYLNKLPQNSNLTCKLFPFPPLVLENIWNRLHLINIEKLIGSIDIFHSSDWLQPPTKAAKVTTIHDLIIYRYPDSFSRRGGHDIVENQKRRLNWVRKEIDFVLADSQSTKSDIIGYLNIPEEKIKVVYLAADESFKPQSEFKVNQIREKYKIKNKYILCVGAREPRKNFEGAIKAFRELGKDYQDYDLVIAGKFGWGEESQKLKVNSEKLKVLGYITQEDLPALYSGAECFVYPSFYEGFGLPVLEAMSCGCPVVTTNKGSLAEIAGNSAQLVDPTKIESISAGIKTAIKNRSVQTELGFKQAAKFSWEKTIKETLKVYQEAVG